MTIENRITDEDEQVKSIVEQIISWLSFLFANKYFLLVGTLFGALGSVVFSVITILIPPENNPMPNMYVSTAVLIIGQSNSNDMSLMMASLGFPSAGGVGEVNYGELSIRVLESRSFLDKIVNSNGFVDRYKIESDVKTTSRSIVLSHSDIAYDSRTGTLGISYEDYDPGFSKQVVDSMVYELMNWFERWEGSASQQELVAMEEKIIEVSSKIERIEMEITAFQEKYGVFSIDQLVQSQAVVMEDLQSQLIQTEIAIANISRFSSIESQELIQLNAQKESILDLINQVERGGVIGSLQLPPKGDIPSIAIEYGHLQISHEIQMGIFQSLQEQYELRKLTTSDGSLFSVLDPAEIPEKKSRPQRSIICIVATISGFLAGLLTSLLVHFFKSILSDESKRGLFSSQS